MKSKTTRWIASMICAGGLTPLVMADEWNQRTVISFSDPVEIPGQVLPAGTYVFKLADSLSDRNIVQVFSGDERHLYATILTIPDERLRPASKTIITFDETPPGSPEALRSWFYPGENYGHDFVYPKPRAVALAKANDTPVPSMPAELAENTTVAEPQLDEMRQAPLKAQQPTEEELEIGEVFVPEDAPPPPPSTLPATAGFLPLIGLAGLLFIGTAGAVRFVLARAA